MVKNNSCVICLSILFANENKKLLERKKEEKAVVGIKTFPHKKSYPIYHP